MWLRVRRWGLLSPPYSVWYSLILIIHQSDTLNGGEGGQMKKLLCRKDKIRISSGKKFHRVRKVWFLALLHQFAPETELEKISKYFKSMILWIFIIETSPMPFQNKRKYFRFSCKQCQNLNWKKKRSKIMSSPWQIQTKKYARKERNTNRIITTVFRMFTTSLQ